MPYVAASVADLLAHLDGIAHLDDDRLVIDDEARFRAEAAADLAWTAAFTTDDPTGRGRPLARLGGEPGSWAPAPRASTSCTGARPRRGLAASPSRRSTSAPRPSTWRATFYETAARADVGAVIFELARSEQTYTYQRPMDYATSVLAGAIAAGWRGPVFIQGDHYQFNAKKYAADPEAMTEEIRRACRLAIDAGYRNIDIDSSTLVDLSKPTARRAAARELPCARPSSRRSSATLETDGVTISVGGEIGEVGKKNSTVEELRAYLDGYTARARASCAPGRDGPLEGERPDRHQPRRRAAAGRRRGRGQPRLRGAPRARRGRPLATGWPARSSTARRTLPDELFHHFPAVETAEIHLATGFQNALYEHPAFPADAAATRSTSWLRRQRRRRAQGRPDRGAVPVHDAQEGDRAVQARSCGTCPTKDEILASAGGRRSRSCSPSCA